MIIGYKCFNKGLINRYNQKFEINNTYISNQNVKFGNNGNGFHMCKNIEDTLRYFDSFNVEIDICIVIGWGNIVKVDDEYNGYYDMYSVEKIKIVKKLSRKEIINIIIKFPDYRIIRFIQGFKLVEEELELLKNTFYNHQPILDSIKYYQEHDLEVYNKKYF